MGKTWLGGLAVGFLVVAHTTLAFAQEPPSREQTDVAIMIAVDVNLEPIERNLLLSKLDEALEKSFEITVTSDGARDFPEGLPETCIAEDPCLSKTAKILKVRKLLLLVVVKVGADIQIDPTFFDTATNTSTARSSIQLTEDIAPWEAKLLEAAPGLLPNEKRRLVPGPGPGDGGSGGTGNVSKKEPSNLHWYVLGAGAGALVVGAAAGIRVLQLCDPGDACEETTLQTVSTVGFVTGGVLTAAGLYLWYRASGDSSKEEPRVGLQAGPGDLGLAIGGRF